MGCLFCVGAYYLDFTVYDKMLTSQLTGQQLSDNDLPVVMEALNVACVKWYNIGMMLRLKFDRLDAIKEQYSNPSDCLRETLKIWLKIYPSHPTWSNIVDALRSSTVDEIKLASELEQKYCSTQDTNIAATHYPVPVTGVAASQIHIQMPTLPQITTPLLHPPVFASLYSMPPQPHPSHPPPWSAPHYHPPQTRYPMSDQLIPPPSSGAAHIPTPTTQVTPGPTSSYLPTPMTASPPYPVLPVLPHCPSSLISISTPPDTPPTVTLPPQHTGR